MIVVEKRMMDLFDTLPKISGFKPIYHFGDNIELNQFITARKQQGTAVYPLIYQTSYTETQLAKQRYVQVQLEIFIATATETSLFNTERWATSYQNILMPTFENIHTAFIKSGIMASEWEYEVNKFPNYGNPERDGDEHKTVDIIDALQFRLNCVINDNCIRTFKY